MGHGPTTNQPVQHRVLEHVLPCRQPSKHLMQAGMAQPRAYGGVQGGRPISRHLHSTEWTACLSRHCCLTQREGLCRQLNVKGWLSSA